jgi:stage V sporulation protein R
LTPQLARKMELFGYQRQANGEIKVLEQNVAALHEQLLLGKYNFGAPRVTVSSVRNDGTLELQHDSNIDGRGLDVERARKVLDYVQRVWRRPVLLRTTDANSQSTELAGSAQAA